MDKIQRCWRQEVRSWRKLSAWLSSQISSQGQGCSVLSPTTSRCNSPIFSYEGINVARPLSVFPCSLPQASHDKTMSAVYPRAVWSFEAPNGVSTQATYPCSYYYKLRYSYQPWPSPPARARVGINAQPMLNRMGIG